VPRFDHVFLHVGVEPVLGTKNRRELHARVTRECVSHVGERVIDRGRVAHEADAFLVESGGGEQPLRAERDEHRGDYSTRATRVRHTPESFDGELGAADVQVRRDTPVAGARSVLTIDAHGEQANESHDEQGGKLWPSCMNSTAILLICVAPVE
jgi:hypothetical protein